MTEGPVSPYYVAVTRDGIFDMLMQLKRILLPQHTEESPEDPLVGLLRMLSFEGQRQTGMLDVAARELTWDCKRRSSLVAHAAAKGLTLPGYRPARVLVLADVAGNSPDGVTVVPSLVQFGTRGSVRSSIVFEGPEDAVVSAQLDLETLLRYDAAGDAFSAFTPPTWTTPALNDALYLHHATLAWNGVKWAHGSLGFPAGLGVSLEYYENHQILGTPDTVAYDVDSGAITVDLTTFLDGAACEGLAVRIVCLDTGRSEVITVDDALEAATTSALGQSSVSTDPARYSVSVEWRPLTWQWDADPTGAGAGEAISSWTLPFDSTHKWVPGTVSGTTGYWVRMRVTAAPGANVSATPTALPDDVTWTAPIECTQGRTIEDRLGTANANPNQELLLHYAPIQGSLDAVLVAGVEWPVVETLYGLGPAAQAVILRERTTGVWSVQFGDGTEDGATPALGSVVTAIYRTGADADGNVGSGTIQVNRSGASLLNNVRNPTPATGWVTRLGDPSLGDTGIEAAKRYLAVEARTPTGVRTPDAIERHVQALELADGTTPVERAALYEETGGYNRAELRVVGGGGALLTPEQLTEIGTALNGTTRAGVRVGGVADTNLRYDVSNYVPQALTVVIAVEVESGYARGVKAAVENAARAYLLPTAKRLDGSYVHTVGGTVRALAVRTTTATVVDRLLSLDVTIAGPDGPGAPDVILGHGGLPDPDNTTVTATVIELDPDAGA